MSTASSDREFATGGRRSGRTTGSAIPIPGGRAPKRKRRGELRLFVRIARGGAANDSPSAVDPDRGALTTLRLWSATAAHAFDFQRFSGGDFVPSIAEALNAESLTRVLYPDDHTPQGRELRLMQEYFLVACSLADAVRRFRDKNADWLTLPDKAAIQLNDTHPSLAVPELMRILLDEVHLGWDEAWDITQRTLAYTNHTLLPEALERWPVEWMSFSFRVSSRSFSRSIAA